MRKSTHGKGSKEPAKGAPQPSLRSKLDKYFFFLWLNKRKEVPGESGLPRQWRTRAKTCHFVSPLEDANGHRKASLPALIFWQIGLQRLAVSRFQMCGRERNSKQATRTDGIA